MKLFAKRDWSSNVVIIDAESIMSADRVWNVACLHDVDPVDHAESSASIAGASGKKCCDKNNRDAVWRHRPNEKELSRRWRERARQALKTVS